MQEQKLVVKLMCHENTREGHLSEGDQRGKKGGGRSDV